MVFFEEWGVYTVALQGLLPALLAGVHSQQCWSGNNQVVPGLRHTKGACAPSASILTQVHFLQIFLTYDKYAQFEVGVEIEPISQHIYQGSIT